MHSNLQIRKKSDGEPQLPMFQRDMALKKVTCIKAAKLPVSKKKKKKCKRRKEKKKQTKIEGSTDSYNCLVVYLASLKRYSSLKGNKQKKNEIKTNQRKCASFV